MSIIQVFYLERLTLRLIHTDKIIPKETITDIITVPPYEIKAKGIPTTGIRPKTIAILINTYKKKFVAKPIAKSFPK